MKVLTDIYIRSLRPPATGSFDVADASCRGLHFRITANNVRSWRVIYTVAGKTRAFTLGRYPTLDLKQARTAARLVQIRGRPLPLDALSLEQTVIHKAQKFLSQGIEPACYLYRHYDPNGDLLYVGVSLVPLRRQEKHRGVAAWRNMICRILIEPFDTREAALAAEEAAIRIEFPKFNLMHNRQRHPFEEIARK